MRSLQELRSIYFPYCLQKQDNGTWVVLNRNYKPVGFNTLDFIEYDKYPVSVPLKITATKLKKLAYDGEIEGNCVYFYNDGCVPTHGKKQMDAYLKKLAILMSIDVEQ